MIASVFCNKAKIKPKLCWDCASTDNIGNVPETSRHVFQETMSFPLFELHRLSLEATQTIIFAISSPQTSTFPDAHIWKQCSRSLLSAVKYSFKSMTNELEGAASYYFNKTVSRGTAYSAMSWIISHAAQTTFMW